MDYLNIALSYGGYTSLDKVYLERVLAGLTEEQKLQEKWESETDDNRENVI